MASLKEYFEKNRYQAKWDIGDRVEGKWNKIPFVGSVGNDTLVNEQEGPRVSVHVDLPIRFNGVNHTVIFLKPTQIKARK